MPQHEYDTPRARGPRHVHITKQFVSLCIHIQPTRRSRLSPSKNSMKVIVKRWNAVAQWRWDTGPDQDDSDDGEGDVCGICRVPYEGCCPACKIPGDDCPLSASPSPSLTFLSPSLGGLAERVVSLLVWGECRHIFHMHCLLKWINTSTSKQQCPMDRRTWGTSRSFAPSLNLVMVLI